MNSNSFKEFKMLKRTEIAGRAMRDEDVAARRSTRENITEEENNRRREAERFRRRSQKYQKGFAYYEAFDPPTILGSRHYFPRHTDNTLEYERVWQHCGAWKFPDETEGSCCRKGLTLRQSEIQTVKSRIQQSLRAYVNGILTYPLSQRRRKGNPKWCIRFRVQGSVIVWDHCYHHLTADQCLPKYTLMIQIWKHA
ncbi:Helitron helicase-like protein [Phytophthora palmivora]|uniref:Helitron helicase-like protein n=1 Tax=Phytophthora palmivora TaxID=4796 RepID=A0A2P4XAC7_9STRA|nr:Helitron helicase-like protein [Phytophthora palmivora]